MQKEVSKHKTFSVHAQFDVHWMKTGSSCCCSSNNTDEILKSTMLPTTGTNLKPAQHPPHTNTHTHAQICQSSSLAGGTLIAGSFRGFLMGPGRVSVSIPHTHMHTYTYTHRMWVSQYLTLSCGSGRKWPSLVQLVYCKIWQHLLLWNEPVLFMLLFTAHVMYSGPYCSFLFSDVSIAI